MFHAEGTACPKAGDQKDLALFKKLKVPQCGCRTQLEMRNGQSGSWGNERSGLKRPCKAVLWSLDFYLANIEVSLRALKRKETWSNLVFRLLWVHWEQWIKSRQGQGKEMSQFQLGRCDGGLNQGRGSEDEEK